jgi:hypothetical protein
MSASELVDLSCVVYFLFAAVLIHPELPSFVLIFLLFFFFPPSVYVKII